MVHEFRCTECSLLRCDCDGHRCIECAEHIYRMLLSQYPNWQHDRNEAVRALAAGAAYKLKSAIG